MHSFAKRFVDASLSSLCLLLLSPALVTIAVAVRLSSPGPIFYRGLRTGRDAKPFRIFKFRTMVQNADRIGGSTTGQNDSRVTPIGRVLRQYKLDELPQLLNVLLGDMSLVGPRPEVEEYTSKFTVEEQSILTVLPGITDLSSLHFIDLQSHVGSDDPDAVFREKILPVKNRLRMQYVRQSSLMLDFKIMIATALRLAVPRLAMRVVDHWFPNLGEPDVNHPGISVSEPLVTLTHGYFPLDDHSEKTAVDRVGRRLGMGCWAVGGHGWGDVNDDQSKNAIREAWDQGVRHFDTADVYGLGHSESILSAALDQHRHEALIATKFGVRVDRDGVSQKDLSASYCHQAVDASRKRLRLDTLPVLYAHWPDGKTSIPELMDTMLGLRDAGKIRHIGLSNFSPAQVREALQIGPIDFVQFEFSLLKPQAFQDFAWLQSHPEITVVTWGSLARGLLANKFSPNTRFEANDSRARDPMFQGEIFLENLSISEELQRFATQWNMLPTHAALLFVLHAWPRSRVLFGAKTATQVRENVNAVARELQFDQQSLLWSLGSSTALPEQRVAA